MTLEDLTKWVTNNFLAMILMLLEVKSLILERKVSFNREGGVR